MNEFLKMDIFFVIASAGVIVLGVLLALVLFRVLRILRHVEHISEMVDDESKLVRADIADLRASVKHEGFKVQSLFKFIRRRIGSLFRMRGK